MPFTVACPACHRKLSVPEQKANTVASCPLCQQTFSVPSPPVAIPVATLPDEAASAPSRPFDYSLVTAALAAWGLLLGVLAFGYPQQSAFCVFGILLSAVACGLGVYNHRHRFWPSLLAVVSLLFCLATVPVNGVPLGRSLLGLGHSDPQSVRDLASLLESRGVRLAYRQHSDNRAVLESGDGLSVRVTLHDRPLTPTDRLTCSWHWRRFTFVGDDALIDRIKAVLLPE